MDAADLRIFEAVARLGRMNRAASELNTVQPNFTARIRLLETELGLPCERCRLTLRSREGLMTLSLT